MRKVIWEEGFRRALERYLKKQPMLQAKVVTALQRLAENPFDTSLKTHKLKGDLTGLWACTVEYIVELFSAFRRYRVSLKQRLWRSTLAVMMMCISKDSRML